ncbi:HCNGP-like protein-domain-containing protein [Crepidotus variabilis]|uniref:HCNGP-like protein-domain-containing protein n=1 Tax=Crepidotus variabilis TaxID=179855 RepID=A0A9P6JQA0_9AGAR|nr:HCNGP-like protein-domain-containing protein [Crepidotus variabilis]
MNGLLAYADDLSDSETRRAFSNVEHLNDNISKPSNKPSSDARRPPKSQIIIKKLANSHRLQNPRAHLPEGPSGDASSGEPNDLAQMSISPTAPTLSSSNESTELSRLRELLRPPAVPELSDWGIPPDSSNKCDSSLQAKLSQFSTLKKDPINPKHFNDSLMSNRSFRNPHLYAKLVEFVDVNERVTNFPQDLWDPQNVKPEWFANRIAESQKERSERQSTAQAPGKRSRIDFASTAEKEPARKSRFQPYSGGAPTGREKQKSRWG